MDFDHQTNITKLSTIKQSLYIYTFKKFPKYLFVEGLKIYIKGFPFLTFLFNSFSLFIFFLFVKIVFSLFFFSFSFSYL